MAKAPKQAARRRPKPNEYSTYFAGMADEADDICVWYGRACASYRKARLRYVATHGPDPRPVSEDGERIGYRFVGQDQTDPLYLEMVSWSSNCENLRLRLDVLVTHVMEQMENLPSLAGKLTRLRRRNERHWTIEGYDLEPLLAELREIEVAAQRRAAEENAKPPTLTDKQSATLEVLKALPKGKGLTWQGIVRNLRERTPRVTVTRSVLTTHIIPVLKKHHYVTNKRGVGYFIDAP